MCMCVVCCVHVCLLCVHACVCVCVQGYSINRSCKYSPTAFLGLQKSVHMHVRLRDMLHDMNYTYTLHIEVPRTQYRTLAGQRCIYHVR